MATRILSQALQRASRPTFQLLQQKQQPKLRLDIFPFAEAGTTQTSSGLLEHLPQNLPVNESFCASRFMLKDPPSLFSSLHGSENRPEISVFAPVIDPSTLLRFTNSSYLPSPSEIQEVILPSVDEETASPMLMRTKRTFNPSTIVRKRRHGYLARKATVGGRRILARRFAKGRRRLSA